MWLERAWSFAFKIQYLGRKKMITFPLWVWVTIFITPAALRHQNGNVPASWCYLSTAKLEPFNRLCFQLCFHLYFCLPPIYYFCILQTYSRLSWCYIHLFLCLMNIYWAPTVYQAQPKILHQRVKQKSQEFVNTDHCQHWKEKYKCRSRKPGNLTWCVDSEKFSQGNDWKGLWWMSTLNNWRTLWRLPRAVARFTGQSKPQSNA